MPAVKARRPGRGPAGGPSRGRRSAPPPPSNVPRLAAIKLNGGLSAADANVSGKSLALALTGLVLFCGAAIAGAAWLGSSLFDAREAFARTADASAAEAGFTVAHVSVAPLPNTPSLSAARMQEITALIVPEGRHSLISLDPQDVRARVESLDWVASARVRRLWPSTMRIEVARRQAYARWQETGEIAVIDANGERLLAERAADHPELPLVVGQGAGPAAEPLLIALESLPQTRAHLKALVRVGDRRWNVQLTSGVTIALPEEGAPQALAQLESLQNRYSLLDRPVAGIDMRTPGRLAVRVQPELAGARHPLLGGV
ncbi:MAG: FtsQ-type POTRA domain-containing protein [Proteobacteria bacterium]|nr:FtsQ-type POTRA domain-containing protein [Pseudomonadota bacterium]